MRIRFSSRFSSPFKAWIQDDGLCTPGYRTTSSGITPRSIAPQIMAESGGVDRSHHRSLAAKVVFVTLHGLIVSSCLWFAFGSHHLPDVARAKALAGCAVFYFVRHLLTLFVLLQRRVDYSEAIGLSFFFALFEIGFLVLGSRYFGGVAKVFGKIDCFALALVIVGSALNSISELQRRAWKRLPTSKGHCYTGGLFQFSVHINYFGDCVLFTGWAMLAASAFAFSVPLVISVSFVQYHILTLDAYLEGRYGHEFKSYARKTAKLVPFVY